MPQIKPRDPHEKKLLVRYVLALLVATLLASCASNNTESLSNLPDASDGAPGEAAESSKTRDTSPDVTDDELAELAMGNAEFAWSFYREVIEPGKNVFFSPYSLSIALAMTWAGARASTEAQMAEALHFTLGQNHLHPAFNRMDLELAKRADAADDDVAPVPDALPFTLNISNGLFAQMGFSFADPFLDSLAVNYGAGVRLMDFENESETSRMAINDWVADRTNDKIDELLKSLSPMTRLVLVNAILFTASWAEPFDEDETEDIVFRRTDGTETVASGMNQTVRTRYTDGNGFKAVELPYDGHQLAMLIVVPDAGEFESVEGSLSAEMVTGILGELTVHDVRLALPKFTFRSQIPAAAPLKRLGMVDAFESSEADFSAMTGDANRLFIQAVVHEAFVAVDERGTEAAAATAVAIGVDSAFPPAALTIDRPFIFAILDRPTGATLFVGRVMDPTQ